MHIAACTYPGASSSPPPRALAPGRNVSQAAHKYYSLAQSRVLRPYTAEQVLRVRNATGELLYGHPTYTCPAGLKPFSDANTQPRARRLFSTVEPVLYHHFHKAAGTTMCKLATVNGESMHDGLVGNCNLRDDDTHCGGGHPDWAEFPDRAVTLSCEERKHLAESLTAVQLLCSKEDIGFYSDANSMKSALEKFMNTQLHAF